MFVSLVHFIGGGSNIQSSESEPYKLFHIFPYIQLASWTSNIPLSQIYFHQPHHVRHAHGRRSRLRCSAMAIQFGFGVLGATESFEKRHIENWGRNGRVTK